MPISAANDKTWTQVRFKLLINCSSSQSGITALMHSKKLQYNSKRPHRCCNLTNNVEYIVIDRTPDIPLLYNWPGDVALNCPFSAFFLGRSGSPLRLIHGSLVPCTKVNSPNGTSIASSVLVWLTIVTNRLTNTHRPRSIGNNKPHLMLCIEMQLIIIIIIFSPPAQSL